jgi:tetratricopeptide (TPR) repeat protein
MNPVLPQPGGSPAPDPGGKPRVLQFQHSAAAIPDHELLRCIGEGSYGEVWLARNILGEFRAVKIVYRSRFEHDRPFQREFEGMQKFEPISRSHPSQLAILHVGRNEQRGCFYYVMELADDAGENSKSEFRSSKEAVENPNDECRMIKEAARTKAGSQIVRNSEFGIPSDFVIRNSDLYIPHTLKLDLHRRDRLPLDESIQIGLALTTALEHLHAHGLVHRDIKPSNIIFVNGRPKLADIGLVASADATMSFVGTSGFLPPEGPGTPQADIYSLGKVLYEVSTGRDRQEFPRLPADLGESEESARLLELNAVVLKACAHDPRQRYGSAREMAADLTLLQRGVSVRRKRQVEHRFSVLRKVALGIAVLALLFMAPALVSRFKAHKSPNPEVIRLYDLARLHLDKTTREGKQQALACIQKALQLDPKFAPGYGTLLEVYFWGGLVPDQDAKIRECAGALMELDDKLPEAHAAMSWVKFEAGDREGAEKEIRQAIKLNPNYALADYLYGYSLAMLGRVAESHVQYQRAQELNPTSREIITDAYFPFLVARQYDQALEQLRKALLLDPNYGCAHEDMAEIYEDLGKYPQAIDEWEKGEILDGEEPAKVLEKFKPLRQAYDENGAKGYWLEKRDLMEVLGEFMDLKDLPGGRSFILAKIYAHMGEREQTLDYLEKARAEGHKTVELRAQPCWDAVCDDPRFQAVLKQAGLAK